MKVFVVVFFLTFFVSSEPATLCLSASQNRIFPIGVFDNNIVVFETQLRRSINTKNKTESPDFSPYWRGITYLKTYSTNNKLISSKLIDSLDLFDEREYISILSASFNKSINKAIIECDLELFEPVSISFCDYNNSCNSLSIKVDKKRKSLFLHLKESNEEFPVTVLSDSTSVASNIVKSNSAFSESFNDNSSFLDISSIRQFKSGNKQLTITHLGYGQRFESADGKTSYPEGIEYKAGFDFNKLNESVFIEPVMHHGNGFDFMMIQ